jgi:hypothetical protein
MSVRHKLLSLRCLSKTVVVECVCDCAFVWVCYCADSIRLNVSSKNEATSISSGASLLPRLTLLLSRFSNVNLCSPSNLVFIRLRLKGLLVCLCVCVCLTFFAQPHALIKHVNNRTSTRNEGSCVQHHERAVHAQRAPVTSRRFEKM